MDYSGAALVAVGGRARQSIRSTARRLPQVHFIDEHRGDVGHHRRHPVCHRHRQDEGDELRGGDTDAQAARTLGIESECRTAKRTCW
mgnify:CR=1 FL=1